eukprot:3022598-Amphidinium_carterae.1
MASAAVFAERWVGVAEDIRVPPVPVYHIPAHRCLKQWRVAWCALCVRGCVHSRFIGIFLVGTRIARKTGFRGRSREGWTDVDDLHQLPLNWVTDWQSAMAQPQRGRCFQAMVIEAMVMRSHLHLCDKWGLLNVCHVWRGCIRRLRAWLQQRLVA